MQYLSTVFTKRINTNPWNEIPYWVDMKQPTEREEINRVFYDELYLYDFDGGGEDEYFFYFESGKAFKLVHEWYYGTEEEQDEDGSYYRYESPQNYWWADEIKVDDLPVEFSKYLVKRDWLIL